MAEEVTPSVSGRERKRRKKMKLEMEAFSETGDRMAPIVGYFPSGYDPVAAGANPDVKVFRNKKKPNRLDLVVRPSNCNVEFVGKSYTGEAAMPQFSTYALGILDKETLTLKIVPIAANKILRLEPRFINGFGEPAETGDEAIINEKEQAMSILSTRYGTRNAKKWQEKRKSIQQKVYDPSALEPPKVETLDTFTDHTSEDFKEPLDRNIPPYDPTAVTPEDAYPLHKIIPKGEWTYLQDIRNILESEPEGPQKLKFWKENLYPTFVIHRVYKLREMQDEAEKYRYASILSYITHLVNFRQIAESARRKSHFNFNEAGHHFGVPPVVFDRFLALFLDPVSNSLSAQKNELLICYVLVLTLFADSFFTEPTDIGKDLSMTSALLRPYFLQLGCKSQRDGPFKKSRMTLPVPLVFKEFKRRVFNKKR